MFAPNVPAWFVFAVSRYLEYPVSHPSEEAPGAHPSCGLLRGSLHYVANPAQAVLHGWIKLLKLHRYHYCLMGPGSASTTRCEEPQSLTPEVVCQTFLAHTAAALMCLIQVDVKQAKALMGQCFDAGVNFFDNAEIYAEGKILAARLDRAHPCLRHCCTYIWVARLY